MNYRDDVQKLKEAKFDAEQEMIFAEWLQAHPEFHYDAACALLKNYYNGEPWTLENLSESAERLVATGVIESLPAKTNDDILADESEERTELVQWIFENRKYQKESVLPERARLSNAHATSIATLRQIKENIEEKRRLTALTNEQLKVEAQQNLRNDQAARGIRTSRWMPVPHVYQDRHFLLQLASENLAEFKRLLERCGRQQLDAILAKTD